MELKVPVYYSDLARGRSRRGSRSEIAGTAGPNEGSFWSCETDHFHQSVLTGESVCSREYDIPVKCLFLSAMNEAATS